MGRFETQGTNEIRVFRLYKCLILQSYRTSPPHGKRGGFFARTGDKAPPRIQQIDDFGRGFGAQFWRDDVLAEDCVSPAEAARQGPMTDRAAPVRPLGYPRRRARAHRPACILVVRPMTAARRRRRRNSEDVLDVELIDLPPAARWREWMLRVEAAIFASEKPVPREALVRLVGQDCRFDDLIADAYLQPVTRGEISRLAGREISRDVITSLKRRGLIDGAICAPQPAAPFAYVTTKTFLEAFGFASLRDLPDLERLKAEGLVQSAGGEADLDAALGLAEQGDEDALEEEELYVREGY
jgi:segregation and condensation protein B